MAPLLLSRRLLLLFFLLVARPSGGLQPPSRRLPPTPGLSSLPIAEVMPQILSSLREKTALVLQAPPGAGKTTSVPLEILRESLSMTGDENEMAEKEEPWLRPDETIVMLEPRRLAARAAAQRMAESLGEPCGQTVGYRVRMEAKVTPGVTRIECVTEGVLLRRLLQDPSLEGVGCVVSSTKPEYLKAPHGIMSIRIRAVRGSKPLPNSS